MLTGVDCIVGMTAGLLLPKPSGKPNGGASVVAQHLQPPPATPTCYITTEVPAALLLIQFSIVTASKAVGKQLKCLALCVHTGDWIEFQAVAWTSPGNYALWPLEQQTVRWEISLSLSFHLSDSLSFCISTFPVNKINIFFKCSKKIATLQNSGL